MGNILLHRFATNFQQQPLTQMHRPFNKNVPQRQNLQSLPNKNNGQKMIPQPKNGKNCAQVTEIPKVIEVTEVKPVTNQVIIANTLSLINQQHGYDQCWNLFLQIVKNIFKFNLIFPVPLNLNGQQLLKNGSFVVCWLKIISKNPYINMPIIHRNVEAQFLPKITQQRQFLQSYLKQHKLNEEKKTPLKNTQNLKRSVLKTSQKKVQFGKDQIIYPVLESYRGKNKEKKKPKQEIKREIRQKLGFILDYFQINDILLLEEVQIIGVIKQFDNTYAVMLVKQRSNSKQRTCIGIITDKKIENHSLKTIQEVEKSFQNLCYLELDGNDPSSVWINNLPSDMSQ